MKALIACEESQAVTIEFRNRGVEAYSCDIIPCSGGHPEWHIQGDVLPLLKEDWDLVISFPPCTDLAVSGARWFPEKRANGSQQRAIDFFLQFTKLKCRWAIENPIGIMSTHFRKPDQIIQPWMFGHGETKATCFWLNGLPPLTPTERVEGREQRIWKLPPSEDRAKLRSKTYQGIARAMANQWGNAWRLDTPYPSPPRWSMGNMERPSHRIRSTGQGHAGITGSLSGAVERLRIDNEELF